MYKYTYTSNIYISVCIIDIEYIYIYIYIKLIKFPHLNFQHFQNLFNSFKFFNIETNNLLQI